MQLLEYLLSLTDERSLIEYDPDQPEYCLKTAEADLEQEEIIPLSEFEKEESGFCVNCPEDEQHHSHTKALRRHDLKTMDIHLNTHLNELSAYVTKHLHPSEPRRKLWEVYCGASRTSQVGETLGMEVRPFSYETGWDLNKLDHQRAFLELQDEECPDEVLLAPECKLWSKMQSLGRRTPAQQEALQAARQHHHDRHLMFVRKVYLGQVHHGRHGHIEHPKHALSWRTRAFRDLPGRRADFDQCRSGAACQDTDGQWKPVKKSTALLTTKQAVQDDMTLQCQGSMAVEEAPQAWGAGYMTAEQKIVTGNLIRLCTTIRQDAIRTVQRLRRNLGHPGPTELAELLETRGAMEAVIEAARNYVCTACAKYKKPGDAAPTSMPQTDPSGRCLLDPAREGQVPDPQRCRYCHQIYLRSTPSKRAI